MNICNITAYHFVDLNQLEAKRNTLRSVCYGLDLKGTILLSPEGINLAIAGIESAIIAFKEALAAILKGIEMVYKESWSNEQPFNRMLVKIKPEIIAFGMPSINPSKGRAPGILPSQLKQWLDEKRDIVLLDARNDYEVRLGKFVNAIDLNIDHFRAFPQAIDSLPSELKSKTVVTYCTGGVRCEKAALLLREQGYDIYQLEGGILQYFKECGGVHYQGECFIYDKRVALDPMLQETKTVQCYACQSPVTPEEQALPAYIPERSCPACYP